MVTSSKVQITKMFSFLDCAEIVNPHIGEAEAIQCLCMLSDSLYQLLTYTMKRPDLFDLCHPLKSDIR